MEIMPRYSNNRPLVTPSAIAFGKFPPPPLRVTPSNITAINSRVKKSLDVAAINSNTNRTYNRILIEACCDDNSVLCAETKESKGCLTIPITEETDFTSQEAAIACSENL
eukprot:6749958-Heterocapsa_arctica.AAC.1